jgi:hypothetical protein
MKKTVYMQNKEDTENMVDTIGLSATVQRIIDSTTFPETPCVICGEMNITRYGCCVPCAHSTEIDDPRVAGLPRFAGGN